jgi:hypothetical protein
MKLTSAQAVIDVARARGLDVQVRPGPPVMPVLLCPAGCDRRMATPALLAALKAWRADIIEMLGPPNESKPEKSPADWKASPVASAPPKPIVELMGSDGKITEAPQGWSPEQGSAALYHRLRGELGWLTIPLKRRDEQSGELA